jgi:predicted ATPase
MAEAIETLTLNRALVLVLEDLHWSDYSTVDLLSYLARRSEPARLMVIGTYRPAEVISARHPLNGVKRELQAHRQCEELALGFLNEGAVAEYLAVRFPDHHFPPNLPHSIHQRTDGNPLFIINLLDYFLTKGLIARLGEEWRLMEALEKVETGMPDNIRQIIEKQVDSLSNEERRVLETASIAGVEFSTSTIAAALDTDMMQVEETCENLVRRRLFLRTAGSSQWPEGEWSARYGFIHALYQNALYDLVPAARRAHLHKGIGEHTELITRSRAGEMAAELAMHFEKARDYRRAALYLQQAAENASHRSANQEAKDLARRGLELLKRLPDTPERAQQELLLQTSLAVALSATEGYGATEVEQAYRRARELCQQSGSKVQFSPVLWGLWRFYLIRSDLKLAREMSQQLLDLAEGGKDAALLVEAHLAAGTACDNLGEFATARNHFEQGIALYDSQQRPIHLSLYGQDPQVALRCFNAWAIWSLGYPNLALATARQALTLAEELRHPETLCFALFFAAWVHQLRRESEETLTYARSTIELATRNGIAQWIAFGSSLQGWALAEQGHLREGITQMRQTLATYRAIGSEISRPHFLGLIAEALMKNGETEEGLRALTEALSLAESTGQRYYESELYRLQGELWLAQAGNTDQAEAGFRRALEVARTQQARSFELRAATSLCRLWQRDKRKAKAQRLLAEVYNRFTEGFDTPDLKEARLLI